MSGRHHRAHGYIADQGWYAIRSVEHPHGLPDRVHCRTSGPRATALADHMAVIGYRVRIEPIDCSAAELRVGRLNASRVDFIGDGHQITIDGDRGRPLRFIRVGLHWRAQATGDRFTSFALTHHARLAGGFRLDDHQGPTDAVKAALATDSAA